MIRLALWWLIIGGILLAWAAGSAGAFHAGWWLQALPALAILLALSTPLPRNAT